MEISKMQKEHLVDFFAACEEIPAFFLATLFPLR
jgi:hypothetical protein